MNLAPHAKTEVVTPAGRYTSTAIGLHWLIAALIGVALVMGWVMTDMAITPLKLKLYNWHKWVGVTVLWLAAVRILWRVTHRAPAMVAMPAWQRIAAHALHGVLYLLMLAQPLSGWIFSNASGYPIVYLRLLPLPNLVEKNKQLADQWHEIHETLGWLLVAVLVVHLLAALKHHLIDKDDTLRRMLPRRR
jgi:cytochrome b561